MNKLDEPIDPRQFEASQMKTSNVARDDFGIDIPIESVPLPSRGVVYPSNSALFDKETLDIKPMTAKEEDILMSRAYIKNGTVITKLLESCLVDKAIDVDSLISGDRNALMLALRITGYGADYKIEMGCPQCGNQTEADFNLSELPIKRLDIDPVSKGENAFEVELPVTKKTVLLRFLNGYDEKEQTIIDERKRKSGIMTNTSVTDRLTRSIISVDGVTDKNKIAFFVKNIPVRDSLSLRKFLDNEEPGVEMKGHMTCKYCYEESEVEIPVTSQFFWPDS